MLTTPITLHMVVDFSRIDFASASAILAAIGTLVLAFFTWRLAVQTRKLANETKEDVRTTKGAAQNSIRPLLIGISPELSRPIDVAHDPTHVLVARPIDVAIDSTNLRLSMPFQNVGTGVALVVGTWARPFNNEGRVSGGPSLGVVGPGEIARPDLSTSLSPPMDEAIRAGCIVFGVQYTDAEGEQEMISETEVRLREGGNWTPGCTSLFRADGSYPDKPFAFGGW